MAEILGTQLVAGIVPFTTEDIYPTHYAKYGNGGWQSVNTIEERDAIAQQRIEEGMSVYVLSENKHYIMKNGTFVEYTINTENVDGLQETLDEHERMEKEYHDNVVRTVEEVKTYVDKCMLYNKAICGFDENNGIEFFDKANTYRYGDLVVMDNGTYYTVYRCIVQEHSGAFSASDFEGTNMFQEYNRIFAGGAEEMVTVNVTKDNQPYSGVSVTVNNITTGAQFTRTTNSYGIAVFDDKIPYGEIYSVVVPDIEGYSSVKIKSFVSNTPKRVIKLEYFEKNEYYGYDIPKIVLYGYSQDQNVYDNDALSDVLNGKTCTLMIDGVVESTAQFNGRTAQFATRIPVNTDYKIVLPNLYEYDWVAPLGTTLTITSTGGGERTISHYYTHLIKDGIFAISEDGDMYSIDELKIFLDDDTKTEQEKETFRNRILYIGIQNQNTKPGNGTNTGVGGYKASTAEGSSKTPVLSNEPRDCSFMFHIRQVAKVTYKHGLKYQNCTNSNDAWDIQGMPYIPGNTAGFLADMDGSGRTMQLTAYDKDGNNASNSDVTVLYPAAAFVISEDGDIEDPFKKGQYKKGFLPSTGQWLQISTYRDTINEIWKLVVPQSLPSAQFPFFMGLWWSSSQGSQTHAWHLLSGSLSNTYKWTTHPSACRFYDLN